MTSCSQKITPSPFLFYTILAAGIVSATAWFLSRSEDTVSVPVTTSKVPTKNNSQETIKGYANLWSQGDSNQTSLSKESVAPSNASGKKAAFSMEAQRSLLQAALADPAALRVLIQRYETEPNLQNRHMIKSILSSIEKSEVIDFSKRLATSGDAERRKDGLEIIQRLSIDSADLRAAVKQELATEQSPIVLVQALNALQPSADDSTEAHEVVPQLKNLLDNSDASVRRQSVLRLSQWDTTGESTDRLSQLSTDPDPGVRKAAVHALAQIKANMAARKMQGLGADN